MPGSCINTEQPNWDDFTGRVLHRAQNDGCSVVLRGTQLNVINASWIWHLIQGGEVSPAAVYYPLRLSDWSILRARSLSNCERKIRIRKRSWEVNFSVHHFSYYVCFITLHQIPDCNQCSGPNTVRNVLTLLLSWTTSDWSHHLSIKKFSLSFVNTLSSASCLYLSCSPWRNPIRAKPGRRRRLARSEMKCDVSLRK